MNERTEGQRRGGCSEEIVCFNWHDQVEFVLRSQIDDENRLQSSLAIYSPPGRFFDVTHANDPILALEPY